MKRTLARSKPVLLLALCAGLLWAAAGVTRAAGPNINLNVFGTSFNNPIGIDFFEPTVGTGQLLATAFYPTGSPLNFELIDALGAHTQFTNTANLPDELKLATVRTGACTGGFVVGTAFSGNGQQGQIMKINPNGTTVNPWATLPGETLDLRGSLYQDRACAFGGDLIVVTGNEQTGTPADNAGKVWRVNNAGVATLVADIGRHLEGVVTIPNDSARYGPLAGTAIIGDEDLVDPTGNYGANGRIWAVTPTGGKFTVGAPFDLSVFNYPTNVPLHPEDLDLVPRPRAGVAGPEGDLFAVDFGHAQILRAPASDFADKCGLIFVTQEFPTATVASGFSTLTWNAQTSSFTVTPLANIGTASVGHYEHVTFWGGEDCPPVVRSQPNLRIAKTSGGDVNAGGVASFTITAFNDGPGTATGVTITDTLPSGLTWTDNSASCTITTGVLTCNIGDMLVNTSFSVTVSATTSAANCGPVVNVTRVSGTNEINSPQDNVATASLTVKCDGGGLKSGDTATIGFWHNKNGQALIKCVNGGATATNLASWLASNFPYLYGASSSNNLTGKTNNDVAALFLVFFNKSGAKTDAQVMGGALAAYVTSSTLSGGNCAGPYGFNVTAGGTGLKTYNVGSNGTALGLVNNQSYTIQQLLAQANLMKKNGTFNATAWNDVFDGINQKGDIN